MASSKIIEYLVGKSKESFSIAITFNKNSLLNEKKDYWESFISC